MDRLGVIYMVFLFTVVTSEDTESFGQIEDVPVGYVSFSGTTVTLTCPLNNEDDPTVWSTPAIPADTDRKYLTLENYNEKKEGLYRCTLADNKAYYIYIRAVVCEGCVELDTPLAFGVIFADILITLGVVLMVYICARKKTGTATPQRANQQPQQANRPPIPPNPDYQTLNPATRGNAVYAEAKRR